MKSRWYWINGLENCSQIWMSRSCNNVQRQSVLREIKDLLLSCQQPFTKSNLYGKISYWIYSIEFQRTSLPNNFPCQLFQETQSGDNDYPLWRQRNHRMKNTTATTRIMSLISKLITMGSCSTPLSSLCKSIKNKCLQVCNGNGVQFSDSRNPMHKSMNSSNSKIGSNIRCNEAVQQIRGIDKHWRCHASQCSIGK